MSDTIDQEIRILRAIFWSERDPEGRAFVPLADAYLRKGDAAEALALLDDGLARHPGFASAHLVAARAHRARGDAMQLGESVVRTLELDPGNAEALRIQGEMAEARGDLPLALDSFREALRRNPGWEELEERIERLVPEAEAMRSVPMADGASEPQALEGAFEVEPTAYDAPDPEPGSREPDLSALDDFGEIETLGDPVNELADPGVDGGADGGMDFGVLEDAADFDALSFELEEEPSSGVERDRAGDLEAHARMLEGYAEGLPSAPPGSDPPADSGVGPELLAGSGADPEPGTDDGTGDRTGADIEADTEAGIEADTEADTETHPETRPEAETHPEIRPESRAESRADAGPLPPDETERDTDAGDDFMDPFGFGGARVGGADGDPGAKAPRLDSPWPEGPSAPSSAPAGSGDAGGSPLEPAEGEPAEGEPAEGELVGGAPAVGAASGPASGPATEPDSGADPDPGEAPALVTRTLGELYARQGLLARAVEVFETLAARDPADPALTLRLQELRARLAGGADPSEGEPVEPVGEVPVGPADPAVPADPVGVADPVSGATSATAPATVPFTAPAAGISPTPLTPAPLTLAPEELAERMSARPVGAHFADLLAWTPGAIPVEALSPGAVPIDALAPGAVPIDALAPGDHPGPPAPLDADAFQRWLRERHR